MSAREPLTAEEREAEIRAAAIRAVENHPSTTFMAPCESLADAVLDAIRPALLLEVERLRAERDEFCDRVDTLTAVAQGNKRHVAELFAAVQTAQRERDEARARVAELEQQATTVRTETLREAADAVAARTGNPIDSNAKMLRHMADAEILNRPTTAPARVFPNRNARCATCGHSGADHHHANTTCWAHLPRKRRTDGTWGPVQLCQCREFTAGGGSR